MWVIFKYLLILIPNIIQQNRFCMITKTLEHEIFTPYFMSLDMFQCLLVYSLWEHWNRISFLLLCENCINFNYVELIHSAFQVYSILLLFCLFILLIFESLILKLQLKIFIYLKTLKYIVELHVTFFCIFQVSCKCVIIISQYKKLKIMLFFKIFS